ncbi:DUF3566 domain-containing protein [Dermatobacter hominis]|uniref:DUF3566 domain-containing protein n=1 Tax=Dermatobacter hominis TaxID=2884263 RepID=UPI001D0F4D2B|nr:DUF3566 domain-containing protein [Dermatobacter hominis]UDY34337.1 DUF3566 domain-containing protein [Dermatobacter hominis]
MSSTRPADTGPTPAVPGPAERGQSASRSAARRPVSGSRAADPGSGTPTATAPAATGATRRSEPPSGPPARRRAVEVDADPTPNRVLGYRRQRFEARKVRRLVRHIDPWSMLKLAVLVSLCMWLISMIAAVILWTVARSSGTVSSLESFVNSSLQLQDWKLDGEFLFRQFGLISLLLHLGLAASIVVATLVFNLISDIIGGVWVSVIEEESARPIDEPAQP